MTQLILAVLIGLTQEEATKMVASFDNRMRTSGDYKGLVYFEWKQKNKPDSAAEAWVYRRSTDLKFMIVFSKPKDRQGQGYLRLEKNMWLYDPSVGKWERRTERERIGGTDTRRTDLDQSTLALDYTVKPEGEEQLGKLKTFKMTLKMKSGADVAYPLVTVWFDAQNNLVKRQDFSESGKLMRTIYTPRWNKQFSPSKNGDVFWPAEIRIFDELEKGNNTAIVLKTVDLAPLEENIFTKAWLESKSR